MTIPNERTRAIILAWEFLREISDSSEPSVELRTKAQALLRHYPLPYELIGAARLVPSFLAEPGGYFSDTRKPNTVRSLIEWLHRFDPNLRVVVDGPDDGFVDLRNIVKVSLPPDPPPDTAEGNAHQISSGSDEEQVIWITGSRSRNADRQAQLNSGPGTNRP